MILTPESTQLSPLALKSSERSLESSTSSESEPPPQYEPRSVKSLLKPVNYVSTYRQIGSLEGTYAIDATMQIPSVLLPPLDIGETEETRKHLRLETKTGSIHADVTLIDRPHGGAKLLHKSGRVTMEIKTPAAGSISLQIHASDSPTRLRFYLRTSTRSGSITIHLPRSFKGNMIISVPLGFVNISQSLSQNLTTISEVSHTRRCFVGDISHLRSMSAAEVDEVHIETKLGNVTLLYDDETIEAASDEKVGGFVKMSSGLFGRLFSRWS